MRVSHRVFLVASCAYFALSPAHASQWARTYTLGGTESAYSVQPTSNGGYIVAGYADSFGAGGADAWVIKLDGSGNPIWQKTFGGTGSDVAYAIQTTADGGYIAVGFSQYLGAGNEGALVLKLDGNGNTLWQKTYGSRGAFFRARSVQATADGGYIVAGDTLLFGPIIGVPDAWVLKLDGSGNIIWQNTYGGAGWDEANSVQPTADGGYIVGGSTSSFGAGDRNAWILKLDGSGNIVWQKAYGGESDDDARQLRLTADGGYIFVGVSLSFAVGPHAWAVKTDADGNVLWQKILTNGPVDTLTAVQPTADGGYIVVGSTDSGASGEDAWILKLNAGGNVIWQRTYGGARPDPAYSVGLATDGGYIVVGGSYSFSVDSEDVWVLKLDANGDIFNCGLQGTANTTTATSNATARDSAAIVAASSASAIIGTMTANTSYAVPHTQCHFATFTPTEIPVLSEWTRISLWLLVVLGGAVALRRRRGP